MASNRTCQFCEKDEASHFCYCTGQHTIFCMQCFARHSAKYPRLFHQLIPIAVLRHNPEEYVRKYEALTEAVTEVRRNVEQIERFAAEFTDMMQNCILS